MKPQLVLLGAPGSGKGTQAKRLVADLGYKHISTGDLLRSEIEKGSELGNKVKSIMDGGQLVSDEVVLELLKANCDLANDSYIFDGFPRNIEQTKALDEHILGSVNTKAIYFDIDLEKLVQRITNRRIAPKSGEIYNLISKAPKVSGKCDVSGEDLIQRKDDNEETVRKRLEVFKATIDPIISYYSEKGILEKLDADADPDVIFDAFRKIVKG